MEKCHSCPSKIGWFHLAFDLFVIVNIKGIYVIKMTYVCLISTFTRRGHPRVRSRCPFWKWLASPAIHSKACRFDFDSSQTSFSDNRFGFMYKDQTSRKFTKMPVDSYFNQDNMLESIALEVFVRNYRCRQQRKKNEHAGIDFDRSQKSLS